MTSLLTLTRRAPLLVLLVGLALLVVMSRSPVRTVPAAQRVLDYTPVTGATFNRPIGTSAQQRAIFTALNNQIDATPAGATIRIAVFSFSETATADRLIAARQRGVNVQLIFDDHHIYKAEAKLRTAFGKNPNALSFVVYCHKSCRGTGGNMHDKIFLFSQAGQATNVVNVGSDNITRHNAVDQWSDMYMVVDDPALYFTYSGVFEQMKYDSPMRSPYIRADVNGYEPQFYPDPVVKQANDPVYAALSQIRCNGVPTGFGSNGHTVVNISQHAWNGPRGIYLAKKVAGLERSGCLVNVIYGVGMGGTVKSELANGGVPMSAGTHQGVRTHEKVLLVNGWYGHNPTSKIVWTGSHNWSDGALTRDEVIFKVEDAKAYAAYRANFRDIWLHG